MLRIAICDDEAAESARAKMLTMNYFASKPEAAYVLDVFPSPAKLRASINKTGSYDIIILDVFMPGELGTETARKLRAGGDMCDIIFLTTSSEHALAAFSVDAAQYIVKPYEDGAFLSALGKSVAKYIAEENDFAVVKTRDGIRRVNGKSIVYCNLSGHYMLIHMTDGVIEARIKADELLEMFTGNARLYKYSSGCIINLEHIAEISPRDITMTDGSIIAVIRGTYKEVQKAYLDRMLGDGDKN